MATETYQLQLSQLQIDYGFLCRLIKRAHAISMLAFNVTCIHTHVHTQKRLDSLETRLDWFAYLFIVRGKALHLSQMLLTQYTLIT